MMPDSRNLLRAAPPLALACLLAAGLAAAGEPPADGTRVEKWPDGKKKVVANYRKGRLEGSYEEYGADGKLRVRAGYRGGKRQGAYSRYDKEGRCLLRSNYVDGRLSGPRYELHPNGRVKLLTHYRGGRLVGRLVEQGPGGRVLRREEIRSPAWPERSVEELRKELAKLDPAKAPEGDLHEEKPVTDGELKAGKVAGKHLSATLGHLKAYRYIARVPYRGLAIHAPCQQRAQHAVVLLSVGKVFSHTPPRPAGMDEAFYKLAREGTSKCNLHFGTRTSLRRAVSSFMFDSDARNIAMLGHRRWCLEPGLARTGFGISGGYISMWALDRSGGKPAYDFIPFPTSGPHPVEYFGAGWAWSVRLSPKRYRRPEAKAVKVSLCRLDPVSLAPGAPLKLDHHGLAAKAKSVRYCVIFRPEGLKPRAGDSYRVNIGGLKDRAGKAVRVVYDVEFCQVRDGKGPLLVPRSPIRWKRRPPPKPDDPPLKWY